MTNRTGGFTNSKLIGLAVVILAGCGGNATSGDVVWIHGQATPLFGHIVSDTAEHIEIRVFENGQPGRVEKIGRSQLEQVVTNIDTKRLEQLSPSNPADYRDYAEELAAQHIDPSARALARRLYLIAAASATGDDVASNELRNSALAGLISLADSDSERQKLNMLRFLVDAGANPAERVAESKKTGPDTAQTQLMLELIHAIRKENSAEAIKLLGIQANRTVFQNWSEICSLEEFDRIARVNRPSKPQLSKLLRIELQIVAKSNVAIDNQSTALSSGRRQGWGDFAMQGTSLLSVVPGFENVTNMDPLESIFREGQWMRAAVGQE